jgi:hypothetical protein
VVVGLPGDEHEDVGTDTVDLVEQGHTVIRPGETHAQTYSTPAQFLLKSVGDVDAVPNRAHHTDARWDAFVHVPDPDALAAELAGRDVAFAAPLADTGDGLREFEVADRDGHVHFFGRPR